MNELIKTVAVAHLSNDIYYAFHILGILSAILFISIYCKKYQVEVYKALLLASVTWLIGYLWVYVLAWIENMFSYWGANNIVRGFVWFPLIALIPIRYLRIDRNKAFDMLAPCAALVDGVSHLGCMFTGCCYGYPADVGLFNIAFEKILFPIQPIESVVALLIAVICVLYAKKNHYNGNGKVYPIFLILFGVTRFFLEFLRDNEKIFCGISILAIHAAIMALVGFIWLLVIRKRGNQKDGDDLAEKYSNI